MTLDNDDDERERSPDTSRKRHDANNKMPCFNCHLKFIDVFSDEPGMFGPALAIPSTFAFGHNRKPPLILNSPIPPIAIPYLIHLEREEKSMSFASF